MTGDPVTWVGPEPIPVDPRDVVAEVKEELRAGHREWLRTNDLTKFHDAPLHRWRVDRILEVCREIEGDVLDAGCFVGEVAALLQSQGNKNVVGMDCLDEALNQARGRGLCTVEGDLDAGAIPFADESFDLVLATEVLNALYDPDSATDEVFRVLKPGGRFLITLPNLAGLGNRTLLLFGRPPHNIQARAREGVGYLRMFTFGTLEKLLRDRGFEIERSECTVWCWPFMRFSAHRIPLLNRLWKLRPEYEYGRLHYSRLLAKLLPRLGESMLVVGRKPLQ